MSKLLPALAGAIVVGAASMIKRTKTTAKKAVSKGKKAATAARSKITKKRASSSGTKPARKR